MTHVSNLVLHSAADKVRTAVDGVWGDGGAVGEGAQVSVEGAFDPIYGSLEAVSRAIDDAACGAAYGVIIRAARES